MLPSQTPIDDRGVQALIDRAILLHAERNASPADIAAELNIPLADVHTILNSGYAHELAAMIHGIAARRATIAAANARRQAIRRTLEIATTSTNDALALRAAIAHINGRTLSDPASRTRTTRSSTRIAARVASHQTINAPEPRHAQVNAHHVPAPAPAEIATPQAASPASGARPLPEAPRGSASKPLVFAHFGFRPLGPTNPFAIALESASRLLHPAVAHCSSPVRTRSPAISAGTHHVRARDAPRARAA